MSELISHRDQVANLLATYRTKDPRLVQILETLMDDLHKTIVTVNPIQEAITTSGLGSPDPPPPIIFVSVTLLSFSIKLEWGSVGAQLYEIRQGTTQGTTWATTTFVLNTTSLGASLNPLPVGTHDYLIKSISLSGVYSTTAFAFQIIIPVLGILTLSSSIIDNSVLLYWTIPTSSFSIDHYNIYKDTVKIGEVKGTFAARFEITSGMYTYEVEAVDIIGNLSAKASTSATVRQPPDYTLSHSRLSTWTGTKVNCIVDPVAGVNKLIACIDLAKTFEVHFTSMGWGDPDDQVVAGFERYIQPNLTSGSYTEDYDYGATINDLIVNYLYIKEAFSGTGDVTVTVQTYHKLLSGDAWTGPLSGISVYIASFRYLRTVLTFSAVNTDSMIALSSFWIKLDVKREVDSGWVNALASDTTGTVVYFTKTYKDVDGVECTTNSVSPVTVVVDFVDVPNPTSFKVLCFDSAGIRINQLVYWIARGIV